MHFSHEKGYKIGHLDNGTKFHLGQRVSVLRTAWRLRENDRLVVQRKSDRLNSTVERVNGEGDISVNWKRCLFDPKLFAYQVWIFSPWVYIRSMLLSPLRGITKSFISWAQKMTKMIGGNGGLWWFEMWPCLLILPEKVHKFLLADSVLKGSVSIV